MNDANSTNHTKNPVNSNGSPAPAVPSTFPADSSRSHPALSLPLVETTVLRSINASSLAILPLLKRVADGEYAAIDSTVGRELCQYTPPEGNPLQCCLLTVNTTDSYLFTVSRTADEETLSAVSQAYMACTLGTLPSYPTVSAFGQRAPLLRTTPVPILICLDPLPYGSPVNPLETVRSKNFPGLNITVIHYFSLPVSERESPAFSALALLRLLEPYKDLQTDRSAKQLRAFRSLSGKVLKAIGQAAGSGLITESGLDVFRDEARNLLLAAYGGIPELQGSKSRKGTLQNLFRRLKKIQAKQTVLVLEDARNVKDNSTRLFFDDPENVADVLNALVCSGKKVLDPKFLRKASQRSQLKIAGGLRIQERDNAFYLVDDIGIIAKFGIEHEVGGHPEIAKRTGGYNFSDYIAQVINNSSNSNVREDYPCITFVLYYGEKPWKAEDLLPYLRKCKSFSRLPEEFRKYVNDYQVWYFDISHLDEKTIEKFEGDFWFVVMALQKKLDYELIEKSGRKLQHPQETIDLLHAITGKDDSAEWLKKAGALSPTQEGGEKNMDAQSIPEVYYQGGYKRGIYQGKILNLMELVDDGDISLEHATRKAKMGTDTARFLKTAAQYRREADQCRNVQST